MAFVVVFAAGALFMWAATWTMLDSVFGGRHLPGVTDGPWGFLAFMGWLVLEMAIATTICTLVLIG